MAAGWRLKESTSSRVYSLLHFKESNEYVLHSNEERSEVSRSLQEERTRLLVSKAGYDDNKFLFQ